MEPSWMKDSTDREGILDKLKQSSEVDITVVGRVTRRKLSAPVWFVLDGDKVLLLPMSGSGTGWLKNLVKDPRIEIGVGGTSGSFKAAIVRDTERLNDVFAKFKAKYRAMWSESYYAGRDVFVEVSV